VDGKQYRLIGADVREMLSSVPGALGGHRGNKLYGRLDCPSALQWIAAGFYVRERVFFADEQTALQAGYRPYGCCLPDKYRVWKQGGDPTSVAGGTPRKPLPIPARLLNKTA
jgi:hypothetical protein